MGDFNDLSKSLLTYFIFFLPVAFRRNFFSFFRTVIYRMFIVPSNRPLDDISWKGTKMKRRKVFTFCYVFSQFCGAHRAHSLYYTQYVHNYFFPMFCDITTISGTWNSCWMNNTPYKKKRKKLTSRFITVLFFVLGLPEGKECCLGRAHSRRCILKSECINKNQYSYDYYSFRFWF